MAVALSHTDGVRYEDSFPRYVNMRNSGGSVTHYYDRVLRRIVDAAKMDAYAVLAKNSGGLGVSSPNWSGMKGDAPAGGGQVIRLPFGGGADGDPSTFALAAAAGATGARTTTITMSAGPADKTQVATVTLASAAHAGGADKVFTVTLPHRTTAAQAAALINAAVDADPHLSSTVSGAVVTADSGSGNTFSKATVSLA